MTDLLEQFLVECRDLIDMTTVDLLALENAPDDKERLDGAFRGFHTLKGAAGIVEFAAMGRLLHAAEEVLANLRAGSHRVTGELVSDCLACLDQVARWLDDTAATGQIPPGPGGTADELAARFSASGQRAARSVVATAVENAAAPPAWFAPLLARYRSERHRARAALRYSPEADCFLRGEDPVAAISQIPDLLAVELVPRREWPPLDQLDPFLCELTIVALTAASAEEVHAIVRAGFDKLEVWPIAPAILEPEARAVLDEQIQLATNDAVEGFAGRLASAGQVAANVLRRSGWPRAARAVADTAETAQSTGSGGVFIATLRGVLEEADPTHALPQGAAEESRAKTVWPEEVSPEEVTPEAVSPERSRDPGPRAQVARALRVDVERIDRLISLTAELTVAKNAVGHMARLAREGTDPVSLARALKDQYALLDRLVSELQRAVLGIRVLPMRHVFQHFPRLVREMARELGKAVRFDVDGETTEADKASVEALFEPLLHVLRNALDHGIEPADERRTGGKPPTATIRLRAMRHGDQVIVEITDDGRGIDPAKIRLAAAQRGLVSETALKEMPDQAVTDLIFSPGFSTADAVTSLSGRGVGMDAVRSAVTRLGGSVAVTSQPGIGTSVVFTLPFTILMLRVMTVETGGQLFGLPIDAVIETTRVPRDRITRIGGAQAVVLRDRTVPLILLTDVLGLPGVTERIPSADAHIVVASIGSQAGAEQLCALEVEAFGERMDAMLRPMDGLLADVSGFAGTTLVGDGGVLIVLDLQELLR